MGDYTRGTVDSVKVENEQLSAARKVSWPCKHEVVVKGTAKGHQKKKK